MSEEYWITYAYHKKHGQYLCGECGEVKPKRDISSFGYLSPHRCKACYDRGTRRIAEHCRKLEAEREEQS
ncbi:hypothetical protein LCGC14_1446160 [marine sediment metagenome]|uniref:Uncharacterized protein n=1 Tax=marine sediment metagenome TaxID=412755 RepID=A0A0F9LZQ3_9ZZZZ